MTFNTTFVVRTEHVRRFIQWLRAHYVPSMVEAGVFTSVSVFEVIDPKPEEGAVSFPVQAEATDSARAYEWLDTTGASLRDELAQTLGRENVVWFTTTLESIPL